MVPDLLDDRLRQAMRTTAPDVGPDPAARGAVLSTMHRRRTRRQRVVGAASVVVLAGAVAAGVLGTRHPHTVSATGEGGRAPAAHAPAGGEAAPSAPVNGGSTTPPGSAPLPAAGALPRFGSTGACVDVSVGASHALCSGVFDVPAASGAQRATSTPSGLLNLNGKGLVRRAVSMSVGQHLRVSLPALTGVTWSPVTIRRASGPGVLRPVPVPPVPTTSMGSEPSEWVAGRPGWAVLSAKATNGSVEWSLRVEVRDGR
jgi:hypothetical protein